jgi:L-ascorbate metabolism protein UlaG (beta-lactamase superfamily)
MEIQYYGANCVRLSDNKRALLVDDNLSKLGLKSIATPQDIIVNTIGDEPLKEGIFLINGPGEYEISGISVRGIPARAHVDKDGLRATIYSIKVNDFNIAIIGHVDANLSDDQLEELGVVDVLIIPVGGHGYTLDPEAAVSVIRKVEPKIVIPTHFADEKIKYEVPQTDLSEFLKAIGVSEPEYSEALVLKERDLGDKLKTIVLNRREAK